VGYVIQQLVSTYVVTHHILPREHTHARVRTQTQEHANNIVHTHIRVIRCNNNIDSFLLSFFNSL